jgi:predicted dehydrogenase
MKSIAIIGAGTIARTHSLLLAQIKDRVVVSAVADLNPNAASALAEPPDIVLLCLPHSLHISAGLEALEAGCDLFMEKPLALTTEECYRLREAERKSGRVIFVGQTHQYWETFRVAKRMILEGKIGEVKLIDDEALGYYNYENRQPWFLDRRLAGGGPIFNTTPHQIDHLLYLVDSPVARVSGTVASLRPGLDLDSDLSAIAYYENGAMANFRTFAGTRIEGVRRLSCRVFGTEGSLHISASEAEIGHTWADQRVLIACPQEKEPFLVEWIEFLDALDQGAAPLTGSAYGHNVVSVLEALLESNRTGQPVQPKWLPV